MLVQLYSIAQTQTTDLLYTWANALSNNQPIGGEVIAKGIQTDASGNVYITGYFSGTADFDPGVGVVNLISQGSSDIFFAKYDASGNHLIAKSIGGIQQDESNAIAIDGSGNIYITGTFRETVDFDQSGPFLPINAGGNSTIFFAKYNALGDNVYAKVLIPGTVSSIKVDSLGNAYVTGSFGYGGDFDPGVGYAPLGVLNNGTDIFLAKYDTLGNYVYAKSMGGTTYDTSNSLVVDASGNTYITGFFDGTADFDPGVGIANLVSAGSYDIFLAKYNASGDYVFAKRMGGTGIDVSRSIAIDASSNVYITGDFEATVDFDPGAATVNLISAGSTDIFFAKYTSAGVYVYAKRIGATLNELSFAIAVDGSGNAYITGSFRSTVDFDPAAAIVNLAATGTDIFLAKYNTTGLYVYAKRIGSVTGDQCQGLAITTDTSGNAYIAGSYRGTVDFDPGAGTANLISGNSITNAFAGKYNTTGIYVWAKGFGGYNNFNYDDTGNSIARDSAGNIYITGTFESTVDFDPGIGTAILTSAGSKDIFLAKYSASGTYIYAKRMGGTGHDNSNSIAVDGSGNAYITGKHNFNADFDPGPGTVILTTMGGYGIFIAKYDTSGNYVYAKSINGAASLIEGNAIVVDLSGNAYITGYFDYMVDFDPGAGIANLYSGGGSGGGNSDIFFAKYDAFGNYVFAKGIGGIGQDESKSIARDGNGNVYITGYFSGTVDFDPSAGILNLNSVNGQIFIAKYDPSGNFVFVKQMGGDRSYYIAIDTIGNTIITGTFSGTADFDPSAGIANLTSTGSYDIFFAKYDALGNYVFAKKIGGSSSNFGQAIALDASGNIYITGNFNGVSDFDPGIGIANLSAPYTISSFIAKYDTSGNYIYAKKMGEYGNSIATDGVGNVFLTGKFTYTIDFDPGIGVSELYAANASDIFLARYTEAYLINASAGSNGTISPSGNTYVLASGSQTYTITPSSGFYILDVLVDGVSNAGAIATGTYTFLNVTTSHTISVTFASVCVNSTVPTLSTSSIINCGAVATTLSIASGTLNSATNWQWYSSSCGGTSVGSGTNIIVTPTTTTTYFARGEGGCVTPGACASITITVACSTLIELKLYIEGFYDATTNSMRPVKANQGTGISTTDVDDITLELRNPSTYDLVATTTAMLQSNGMALATFTPAVNGPYYLVVKQRNAIQTWSANAIIISQATPTYDFTNAVTKAYANNMAQVNTGVWAFYSGDINQDDVIDGTDAPDLVSAINSSAFGIQVTDLNGDGSVDNSDVPFFDNNASNSIFAIYPQ